MNEAVPARSAIDLFSAMLRAKQAEDDMHNPDARMVSDEILHRAEAEFRVATLALSADERERLRGHALALLIEAITIPKQLEGDN